MEPLRCLLADIPQKVLADIVQTVTHQDENIEVVGRLEDLSGLTDTLQEKVVDVLILGEQKDPPRNLYTELVEQFPGLLVIGLVDDGRIVAMYKSNVGSNKLVDAIVLLSRLGVAEKVLDKHV
ncbi:MAG: hypothetical protein GY784_10340 [Gammaproteobacteria bacterium]|nr:hypothetical protein [Gammaproteobacteria bacterium]